MSENIGLKAVLTLAVSLMTLLSAYAQPESLGASFSFFGFGVTYDHDLKADNSFLELSLKATTSECFLGRSEHPGIAASFTWNIVIKEWLSSEGNSIRLFAGPGAMIGFGPDYRRGDGGILGLKGRFGTECRFMRNATISISISPVIGSHVVFHRDSMVMKYYRNGLQYALVPEIGIKYRF